MVSYSNTKPFLYGFQHHPDAEDIDLILKNPAECAAAFDRKEADIALVPCAHLAQLQDYKVITNYCIGCNGTVNTVAIFANKDIERLEKIYLDNHSLTSQQLTQILAKDYWKINVEFENIEASSKVNSLQDNEGILLIGDKVFEYESLFEKKYDLGKAWKLYTSLPFTFAVWIARNEVPNERIDQLNKILASGVDQIDHIVELNKDKAINYKKYLISQISYNLNAEKRKALHYFLSKI